MSQLTMKKKVKWSFFHFTIQKTKIIILTQSHIIKKLILIYRLSEIS